MSAHNTTFVCSAQVLGITASGVMSGAVLGFSSVLIPTLTLPAISGQRTLDSSPQPGTPISHITTQWQHAYTTGKSTIPIIATLASTSFAYLSYSFRQSTTTLTRSADITTSNWYMLAAILAVAPIPYTLLVMAPTNKKLIAKAESAASESIAAGKERDAKGELRASREEVEVQSWLKTWASMNTVRGLFPLAAAVVGLCATLGAY